MRKVKKINGYLVVRFNEREKQGYPQLGSFGVIDAEMYTGCIDTDLGAMEYEDADTLEVAVEQARGLESEQDYSGDPPVCTLIVEAADETTEEEVDPQLMIAGFENSLQEQAAHGCRDVDARTAAHELYGYKAALRDLGLLEPEEVRAHICDHVCPAPQEARDQEELDRICESCERFEPPRDTFRHLDPALRGAPPTVWGWHWSETARTMTAGSTATSSAQPGSWTRRWTGWTRTAPRRCTCGRPCGSGCPS